MNKLTRNIDRQTFVDGIARTANSTLASVFLKKKNRTPSCQTLMFVEPKIGLLPHILTFKKYETARRINNAKAINDRADVRSDELPGLLETYSNRSRRTRGVDKRDVRRTERLTLFNVFTGDTLLTTEQGNIICRTSNLERRTVTCFEEHNINMTVLPLLEYDFERELDFTYRDLNHQRKVYSKCIKDVFTLNMKVIQAPHLASI